MTDKPMIVVDDDNEYLVLSILQAQVLMDNLKDALDRIRTFERLGERTDLLTVLYPKAHDR